MPVKVSYFKLNKAAVFREWRTSRSWWLGIGALSLWTPIFNVIAVIEHLKWGTVSQSVFWYALVPALYGFHYLFPSALLPISHFHAYSDPIISFAWVLIAVIIGVIPWAMDRASGGIYSALSAPIKRSEIILVKFWFGVLIVLGIQLLRGLLLIFLNSWAGAPIGWQFFASWWLTNTLAMVVAMATALFLASIVKAWFVAALSSLAVLSLPFAIASFLDEVVHYTSVLFVAPPSFASAAPAPDLFNWLKVLSPINVGMGEGMSTSGPQAFMQIYFSTGTHYLFMAGWIWIFYLIWIVAVLLLAIRLFYRVPAENLDNYFFYPSMWKWLLGAISTLLGYIFANNSNFIPHYGMVFIIAVMLYAIIVFLIFWLLIRLYWRLRNE